MEVSYLYALQLLNKKVQMCTGLLILSDLPTINHKYHYVMNCLKQKQTE